MGKKMQNAPVYFTIGQVRFNPVLALDQFIPLIQDSFRRMGFFDFQKTFQATINFNLAVQQNVEPPTAVALPQTQYQFLDKDRRSGFTLDHTFMTYQTTDYDTFDPFLKTLLAGLEIVHKFTKLSVSERVGLRFLDAVIPRNGEDVTAYLQPSVIGLAGKFKDRNLIHSLSETRTQNAESVIVSRAIIYKQVDAPTAVPIAFPPDLAATTLKVLDKFAAVSGECAVLDNDCWIEARASFDTKSIERQFTQIHNEIDRSFNLMVTTDALKIWA
jgi:uncharacterized protein (TIGR04255 family)